MSKKPGKTKGTSFYVKAIWDEESKVFYSESNIKGLHIEAETLSDFEDIMKDLIPELIATNHPDASGQTSTPRIQDHPLFAEYRPFNNLEVLA